jgi:hypothetical protein
MDDDFWKIKSGEINVEVSDEPYKYAKPAEGKICSAAEILNVDVAKGLTGREREVRLAAVDLTALDDSGVDAFEKGVKWSEEHPHWISFKDRLPEVGEYVLIAAASRYGYTAMGIDKREIDDYGVIAWNNKAVFSHCTHWMKLPNAPKVEEGGDK